jgi:aryl-alcohol dehydrogenase-like predicted oxidoreductase
MGCMTFGSGFMGIGEVGQQGANELVRRAFDAGINFFDTADVYSRGESETILGQSLSDLGIPRDQVVLATKVRGSMSDAASEGTGDVNNAGLSRKHILESCEASLRRLGTDFIDLYQIHGYDPWTPLEETMSALSDLVRQGKVRYVGCSNLAAWHVVKANELARRNGGEPFCSVQAYYSLLGRDLEEYVLPMCQHEGIGTMIWSPLAGGFLSGKFRRGEPDPEGARRSGFDFPPIDRERGYDVVEALESIARDHGATVPQIALAWVAAQPGVSTVVIGAKKMSQLEDNLGATQVELRDEDRAKLDELTTLSPRYPRWMIDLMSK